MLNLRFTLDLGWRAGRMHLTRSRERVGAYLARRTMAAVPLLLGVLTLVFLLVQLAPGDPFRLEPASGVSRGAERTLRRAFEADRPLPTRYAIWLEGFLTGDLGTSYIYHRPVSALLREAAGNTLVLAGLATLFQFLLGTAAGLLAAGSRRAWLDRALAGLSSLAYSVPSFWLGLVLVWIFSVRLGWLPVSQMHSIDAAEHSRAWRAVDFLRHLLLPCLALTLPSAGGIALYVREEVRARLGRPFARSARARGIGERAVVLHALKSALLPLVNMLGLALPGILGGSVVLEVLYAWPGMGRLAYQAVLAKDEPLVLGCAWVTSVLVVAGSMLADLLSAWVDPRTREAA